MVARHFNVSPSAINQWRSNGVPRDRILAMFDLTNGDVSIEEMLIKDELEPASIELTQKQAQTPQGKGVA